MVLGKKEVIGIAVIFILIYTFVGFIYFWESASGKFEIKNKELVEIQTQKVALDKEVLNINLLKNEFSGKKLSNERLEDFLMSSANISDGIEYMEKLATLYGKKMTRIKVEKPTENSTDLKDKQKGIKYYSMNMSFDVAMAFPEITDLLKYIEGSAKKITINQFDMQPGGKDSPADSFRIAMTISIYSINLGSMDKMYEYGRYRFNTYDGSKDMPIQPIVSDPKQIEKATPAPSIDKKNTPQKTNKKNDIAIRQDGFLFAGDNFNIYGVASSKKVSIKTSQKKNISINFDASSYTIKTTDDYGQQKSNYGSLASDEDVNLSVEVVVSSTEIDKNIALDISIINNSGKKINLKLTDVLGRTTLRDRTGTKFFSNSAVEKIYFS